MTLPDTTADFTVMPQAVAGLETRAAGSEELVYDPPSGRVHVLNATAARVLARCDGRRRWRRSSPNSLRQRTSTRHEPSVTSSVSAAIFARRA
jgi:hypothetical protein